jgi:hypothetical protein
LIEYLAKIINAVTHVDRIIRGILIVSTVTNCMKDDGIFIGEYIIIIIRDRVKRR